MSAFKFKPVLSNDLAVSEHFGCLPSEELQWSVERPPEVPKAAERTGYYEVRRRGKNGHYYFASGQWYESDSGQNPLHGWVDPPPMSEKEFEALQTMAYHLRPLLSEEGIRAYNKIEFERLMRENVRIPSLRNKL